MLIRLSQYSRGDHVPSHRLLSGCVTKGCDRRAGCLRGECPREIAMPVDAIPRLREIETRNPDEARAFLQTLGVRLDVTARDEFDMRLNAFSLPNATIGYAHFGAAVSIQTLTSGQRFRSAAISRRSTAGLRPTAVPAAPSSFYQRGALWCVRRKGARDWSCACPAPH
jgi:hypothetical protein